jgi:transcriptional regulator with XRE-family HTH domain
MKPSPLRHPLAILRTMIGLNQTEMADLCGCSSQSIQSVELLRMRLSGKLATKISKATGISLEWLMDGNCEAPPTKAAFFPTPVFFDSWTDDQLGDLTYSIDSFAKYRSTIEAGVILRQTSERPERELSMGKAAQRRRELIDLQDKLLLRFCAQVLQDTQAHEKASLMRWQLKKFLLDQCKRYDVSVETPDAASGGSSETERSPKTAKRPSKQHQD